MSNSKICIYLSDTGGGHRGAAEAVQAGLRQVAKNSGLDNPPDIILDPLAENSHPLNRAFVDIYNYMLRHHQPKMKYYYKFIHMVRPNQSRLLAYLSRHYIRKSILENRPNVIVSVHPMINHVLSYTLKKLNLRDRIKFAMVITDPNEDLWRGWACPDVDLTIAPNDLAAKKLIEWGVPKNRIKVIGMPVHPTFLAQPSVSREQLLESYGLDPYVQTVCVNSGWAGGGNNVLRIYRQMANAKIPLQVIFICGKNTDLLDYIREESKLSPIRTVAIPFSNSLPDLMSAVDLMVTKGGGLTTFQAVAKRLPMAIDCLTEPMPQERGTVNLLVDNGLAYAIRKPEDIVSVLKQIKVNNDRSKVILPSAHSLDRTDAVFDIAREILQLAERPVSQEVFAPLNFGGSDAGFGHGASFLST